MKTLPTRESAECVTHKARDSYLDALRTVAILRVVLYHLSYEGWLAVAFPSMGVMFALGGRLTAAGLDKHETRTIPRRLVRILPAFWFLGATVVSLSILIAHLSATPTGIAPHNTIAWLFPVIDPRGADAIDKAWRPLWYLRAYIWFLMLSPLIAYAFRRHTIIAAILILACLSLLTADDVEAMYDSGPFGHIGVDLLTYGGCWLIGMASISPAFQRIPKMWIALAIGILALTGLRVLHTHSNEVGRIDLYGAPIGNAWWSAACSLFLLRFRPGEQLLQKSSRIQWFARSVSGRSLTIYLWHGIAILTATKLIAQPLLQPLVKSHWTPNTFWWAVTITLMATAFAAVTIGRLEDATSKRLASAK